MKARVYVETTVISYLTARPNRDLIITAYQQVTREWWYDRRPAFDLFASQLVIQEASGGDEQAAAQRLDALQGIPLLPTSEDALALAKSIVNHKLVPPKAFEDAAHIAIATTNGMDYLLTWNLKHIANAVIRGKVETLCREEGYQPPVICTPEELSEQDTLEDNDD